MSETVDVIVLDDMRLALHPQEIARDAEHNSATFKIVQQPPSLDPLACRAEVRTANATTWRPVINGEFSLTNDVAVAGTNYLQLVYGDGTSVQRKTSVAGFHVSPSINAVDPSAPDFPADGIAQLQNAAFANAVGSDTTITFYNMHNQPVGLVTYPIGAGGALDEAAANLLYVRQDGASVMTGDLRMTSSQGLDAEIGIYLGGRQGGIFWANSALALRRGAAGEPVMVENFNGTGRSEVVTRELGAQLYLTQAVGDARYLTPDLANLAYLRRDGGQMSGPFISQNGTGNTNLGVSVGENTTGFWRSSQYLICSVGGATMWQVGGPVSTPSVIMGVALNMATQPIQNLADPRTGAIGVADAVNRRTMDAAIAAIPRPTVPASRAFIANEVTITSSPQAFFDQPFFTNDNTARTILVTAYLQFAAGTPSAFYDLEYSTNLSAGLIEKQTVYPTAQGFMGGAGTICFAATVTPASSQIHVQLSVRQVTGGTAALVQIGGRADQRSYVVIQEMTQ